MVGKESWPVVDAIAGQIFQSALRLVVYAEARTK